MQFLDKIHTVFTATLRTPVIRQDKVNTLSIRFLLARVLCVLPSHLFCIVDVPVGVTQKEGHAGFHHLPLAVLAFICFARWVQPLFSLVHREVEFCVQTNV